MSVSFQRYTAGILSTYVEDVDLPNETRSLGAQLPVDDRE
jgi:hypothetical protein